MYEEEIKRGVKLLDREAPGWLQRIDVAKLEMSSYFDCVAAQAMDCSYRSALGKLGLDYFEVIRSANAAVQHGFTVIEDSEDLTIASYEDMHAAYATLTAEWLQVISELRAPATANA